MYETDSNKRKRNHSNVNTKSHGQKNQCSIEVKAKRIFLFPPAPLKFCLKLCFQRLCQRQWRKTLRTGGQEVSEIELLGWKVLKKVLGLVLSFSSFLYTVPNLNDKDHLDRFYEKLNNLFQATTDKHRSKHKLVVHGA